MSLLHEVLTQVQSGQAKFAPETDTPEGLQSFQEHAAALKRANNLGYLDAIFIESRFRDTWGYVREVHIKGTLTYLGREFLSSEPQPGPIKGTDIIQLKPSIYGIGIDLRAAYNWVKSKFG